MARVSIGNRLLDNPQKPVQSALQIGVRVCLDAGSLPRPGQPIGVRMRYRLEEPLKEQVVDVDAQVAVLERNLNRARKAQRSRSP